MCEPKDPFVLWAVFGGVMVVIDPVIKIQFWPWNMRKKTVLLHCHIFKNGGTTIDSILRKNFGELSVELESLDGQFLSSSMIVEEASASRKPVVSISSHKIGLPAPQHETIRFISLVMLREPLDRVGSMYDFYRRQEQDINHECLLAKRASFREFVSLLIETGLNSTFSNLQASFFLGNTTQQLFPSQETLPFIVENFNATKCVGVLELFDHSMVLWEEYLREFFPDLDMSYIRKNISSSRSTTLADRLLTIEDNLGTELVARFKQMNSIDYLLYNLAKDKLLTEIENIRDFEDKLSRYKFKNKIIKSKEHATKDDGPSNNECYIQCAAYAETNVPQVVPFPKEWYSVRTGLVDIVCCELLDPGNGHILTVIEQGKQIEVRITVFACQDVNDPIIGLTAANSKGEVAFCMNSFHSKPKMPPPPIGEAACYSFRFTMPPLNGDLYTISPAFAFGAIESHTVLCHVKKAVMFIVPVVILPRPPGFLFIKDYFFIQPSIN